MIYFEDLVIGEEKTFGHYDVTRDEVLEFARKYDPQPFHLSDEAAAQTHFGRLAASGWHTAAMTMAVIVKAMGDEPQASLGSPGVDELRWLKPVYPGDTIRLQHTILESRPLRKRGDTGIVRSLWEMFNQHDEKVLQMEGYGMFRRRHPATAEELARLQAGGS